MRIPVVDGQRVQPRAQPTPYGNLNFDTGSAAVEQGLRELGAGVGQAVEAVQKTKQRANAVAVNDLLTAYQVDNITALDGDGKTPGFLGTKGKEAAFNRADVLTRLEERGGELEESLSNDDQKKLFRQHAQKIYLGSRARIESHVLRENEEAEVSSLKARMETSLNAISNNYRDEGGAATQAEKDVREMLLGFHHTSPEEAKAKVDAWHASVAVARLQGYLTAKDWKGAEELYEKTKGTLGAKARETLGNTIATLKADMQAQGMVDAVVDAARNPLNERVDAAAAQREVVKLEKGPLRDEVQQRLDHALSREAAAWKQKVDSYYTRAFGAYLASDGDLGAINPADKAWLIQNAPDEWARILGREYSADARARAAARAARAGSRGAGETEEQRQALIELKADIFANPEKYKGMTPEAFFSQWRDKLSSSGYSKGGDLFARVQKDKPASGMTEFRAFVANEVDGTPLLKDKQKAKQFRALMGDEFFAFKERNPDRAPSSEELKKMRDAVWTTRETWFGLGSPAAALKERAVGPGTQAGGGGQGPAPANPQKSKLAPGLYKTKDGRVVIVDAQGNKRFQ